VIHPLLPAEPATTQLMGDELMAGALVAQRSVLFDRQCFEQFAAVSGDAHPLHYDAAYARAHGFAAPVAHGLLVVAITALGATTLSPRLHDSMIAMLGAQAAFHAPAFLGDRVDVRLLVRDVVPKSGNRCIATFDVEVRSGERLLATVQHQYLLRFSREGAQA
jgi:3-hydroxybutyryl-CoA dehydratase